MRFIRLALILFCLCCPAWGAITLGQHCTHDNGNNKATTASCTLTGVTAGSTIACGVSFGDAATIVSVSDPTNGTYTQAWLIDNTAITQTDGQFYFQNITSGT